MHHRLVLIAAAFSFATVPACYAQDNVLDGFRSAEGWALRAENGASALHASEDAKARTPLVAKGYLSDIVLTLEYRLPGDGQATVYLHGRYALPLPGGDQNWHRLDARFRAPRFDEGY